MTEASAPIPATANFINPDAMHRPTGYTRAEGLGELGMGAAAAVGGSGAGLLLAGGGFWLVSVVAVAPCLLLLAAVAAGGRRRAAAAPTGPALEDPPRNWGGRGIRRLPTGLPPQCDADPVPARPRPRGDR